MSKQCRLCLGNENLVNIFDKRLVKSEILRKYISLATGIQICQSDGCNYLCKSCVDINILLHKYRQNAVAIDTYLKEYPTQRLLTPPLYKSSLVTFKNNLLKLLRSTGNAQKVNREQKTNREIKEFNSSGVNCPKSRRSPDLNENPGASTPNKSDQFLSKLGTSPNIENVRFPLPTTQATTYPVPNEEVFDSDDITEDDSDDTECKDSSYCNLAKVSDDGLENRSESSLNSTFKRILVDWNCQDVNIGKIQNRNERSLEIPSPLVNQPTTPNTVDLREIKLFKLKASTPNKSDQFLSKLGSSPNIEHVRLPLPTTQATTYPVPIEEIFDSDDITEEDSDHPDCEDSSYCSLANVSEVGSESSLTSTFKRILVDWNCQDVNIGKIQNRNERSLEIPPPLVNQPTTANTADIREIKLSPKHSEKKCLLDCLHCNKKFRNRRQLNCHKREHKKRLISDYSFYSNKSPDNKKETITKLLELNSSATDFEQTNEKSEMTNVLAHEEFKLPSSCAPGRKSKCSIGNKTEFVPSNTNLRYTSKSSAVVNNRLYKNNKAKPFLKNINVAESVVSSTHTIGGYSLLQTLEIEPVFNCYFCSKAFDSLQKLRCHQRFHKVCLGCNAIFGSNRALASHQKKICFMKIIANPPSIRLLRCDALVANFVSIQAGQRQADILRSVEYQ